jgi:hypothetical protein
VKIVSSAHIPFIVGSTGVDAKLLGGDMGCMIVAKPRHFDIHDGNWPNC